MTTRRTFFGVILGFFGLETAVKGDCKANGTESFPVHSFVIIRGHNWKKEDHPGTWWIKNRCAVVIGSHYNEEGGEEIEVAITKPNGDMILNTWMLPEELELAEHQRNKPVWEQE